VDFVKSLVNLSYIATKIIVNYDMESICREEISACFKILYRLVFAWSEREKSWKFLARIDALRAGIRTWSIPNDLQCCGKWNIEETDWKDRYLRSA
jgi:hypothetical protein